MNMHFVSAGSREELVDNINELHISKDNLVQIVPFKDLLIAFYYA